MSVYLSIEKSTLKQIKILFCQNLSQRLNIAIQRGNAARFLDNFKYLSYFAIGY